MQYKTNIQYTINGLQQKKIIELGLDFSDSGIIRCILDFKNTEKVKTIQVEGHEYFWIKYQTIIDILPSLKINNKIVMARRLKKLVDSGLMFRYIQKKKAGTYTYYRFDQKILHDLLNTEALKNTVAKVLLHTALDPSTSKNPIKNFLKKDKKGNIGFPRKPIDPVFKSLINRCLELGNFTNRIPSENKKPTKTYLKIVSVIDSLQKGEFFKNHVIDKEWSEKQKIPLTDINYVTFYDIEKALTKAIKRFNLMKQEGYSPSNKEYLTNNFLLFLYNDFTNKSWFLLCLNKKPVKLKKRHTLQIKESLGVELINIVDGFLKERSYLIKGDSSEENLYKNINDLQNYYNKNKSYWSRQSCWPGFGRTFKVFLKSCLLYTSPSPRDRQRSRMPSSA